MARYFGIVGALAAACLLAGCAKPSLEVGSITEIKAPSGSIGSDVYASRRVAGEQVPGFAGGQIVEVRTYHSKERFEGGGTSDEISGARCKMTARDFSAEFITPAKGRVLIYR